jgi:hypothetical protein
MKQQPLLHAPVAGEAAVSSVDCPQVAVAA